MVRAVRGAITVENNNEDEILMATSELLSEMVSKNDLSEENIISVIFTATMDLNATFPARAARKMGWNTTPLMCMNEIDVPGSLEKCIRILIHFNTKMNNNQIKHIYLKKAVCLRPDLTN